MHSICKLYVLCFLPCVVLSCVLSCSVLNRTDHPWSVIYEFVSNRIQAIRQDITYQAGTFVNMTCYSMCTHKNDTVEPNPLK